ncbi:MAG: hypothetical protein ACFFKA_14995 [Candidatus Thorarchaeota archaeon]
MVSIGDCESLEVLYYNYYWGKTGSNDRKSLLIGTIPVPGPSFSIF